MKGQKLINNNFCEPITVWRFYSYLFYQDGDVPDSVMLTMGSSGNTETMIQHKDDTVVTMPTVDVSTHRIYIKYELK